MGQPERKHARLAAFAFGGLIALTSVGPAHAQVAADPIEPARAAIRLKNFRQAVDLLRPLADKGDPQAQHLLGSLYRIGLGAPADAAKARALLLAAAQRNHAAAAYSLALLLAQSNPPQPQEARNWLQRAAAAGHVLAAAALERGSLPLQFLPGKDLTEVGARRAALWLAAQQNDVQLVTVLLDADSVKLTDEFGRGLLSAAAQGGARDVVVLLLQRGARPDQSDSFGVTPLMLAARAGDMTSAEALLKAHAPLDAVDRVGNSALMYAAAGGQQKVVALLLEAGAPFTTLNAQGWSALDWALDARAPSAAALLKSRGLSAKRRVGTIAGNPSVPLRRASGDADLYRGLPDVQVAASRSSAKLLQAVLQEQGDRGTAATAPDGAVYFAAVTGSTETLQAVLAAGANANPVGQSDPLRWIITRGSSDVLPVLLARRGDTREPGESLLLTAVRAHRLESVRALLNAGAATDVKDEAGRTALMLAAASEQPDVAQELLQRGAQTDQADKSGRTALWYAAAAGDLRTVAALLEAKAEVDTTDEEGLTPLAAAAARGRAPIVQALIKAGARANVKTRNDSTALMLAAQGGHTEVIQQLLAADIKVDGQNRFGDTALIVATRAGQLAAVRELVAAGASGLLRNADRASALDVANALQLKEIEAVLQRG